MRKIIHVDMDCFYAAVEMKYNPQLKGKPVGIGGPPQSRSVLCTASYEARKFGVRAAMPSSRAVKLCPQLILVPPNFSLYKKESARVREIFQRFTNKIEPLSLDEAYLDVSECKQFHGSATLIAQAIRKAIFDELELTASAGIAPNKFLAKVASDWNKPNGQYVITPDKVDEFVEVLPVTKIFGVGKVTGQKLHELGIITCGDLQKTPLEVLVRFFGSRAQELKDFSYGVDHREVITEWERRSLTVEETFSKDVGSFEELKKKIPELYKDFLMRLEKGEYGDKVRGAVVKVKFFDFKQTTHEEVVQTVPSLEVFEKLIQRAWERRAEPVRLIGIGVRLASKRLDENNAQLSLNV